MSSRFSSASSSSTIASWRPRRTQGRGGRRWLCRRGLMTGLLPHRVQHLRCVQRTTLQILGDAGDPGWVGRVRELGGRRNPAITQETFRRIEIVAVQVPTQRRILVWRPVVEVVLSGRCRRCGFNLSPSHREYSSSTAEVAAGLRSSKSLWPPSRAALGCHARLHSGAARALVLRNARVPARVAARSARRHRPACAGSPEQRGRRHRLPRHSTAASAPLSRDPIPEASWRARPDRRHVSCLTAIRRMPKATPVPLVHSDRWCFMLSIVLMICRSESPVKAGHRLHPLACAAVLLGLLCLFPVFAPGPAAPSTSRPVGKAGGALRSASNRPPPQESIRERGVEGRGVVREGLRARSCAAILYEFATVWYGPCFRSTVRPPISCGCFLPSQVENGSAASSE